MSYANVTASGALPLSEQVSPSIYATVSPPISSAIQPKPDPALLNTEQGMSEARVADDAAKINVVPNDFKQNPTVCHHLFRPVRSH